MKRRSLSLPAQRSGLTLGGLLLAAGCGGGGVTPDAPTLSTAPQAVSAFLRAAADSNLTQMGALWGTSGGVVSRTEANEKRLVVLQAYLKGDSTRILADDIRRQDPPFVHRAIAHQREHEARHVRSRRGDAAGRARG